MLTTGDAELFPDAKTVACHRSDCGCVRWERCNGNGEWLAALTRGVELAAGRYHREGHHRRIPALLSTD